MKRMSALILINKGSKTGHVSTPAVKVLTVFFSATLCRGEFTEDVAVLTQTWTKDCIPFKFTVGFEVESQKRRDSEL